MICIIDLLDPNDNFVTYESIINSNVKTNYVEYAPLQNDVCSDKPFYKIGFCLATKALVKNYLSIP